MLQTAAFTDLRNYVKTRIGSAQYLVGSTWHNATIVDQSITADGIVRIKCQLAPGAACTIEKVRLYNTASEAWVEKTVNVEIETASTNLLQWFDFNIKEREVS